MPMGTGIGAAAPHAPRRAQRSTGPETALPGSVDRALAGPAAPLDPALRTDMEQRFGQDFSDVRIHTGASAEQSAKDVKARAYTVGHRIVFGRGRFAPASTSGRWLLAHELAHVAQQRIRPAGTGALMRVPDEDGIDDTPPRYSYSTNCGWIDWMHADPDVPARLIEAVQDASNRMQADASLTSEVVDAPAMESSVLGVVLSRVTPVFGIKRPLSQDEVVGVAFRAFALQSLGFEALQSWTDAVGESSFSEEDLVSNLIAFYMAARHFDRAHIETLCGVWDAARSLAKFNGYGFRRVHQFTPASLPAGGAFPADLQTITPAVAGGPLMTGAAGVFRTTGSVFTRELGDYQVILGPSLRVESVTGSSTIDLSGTTPGSANGPHFEVRGLPATHGLKCRWVIRLPNDDRVKMLGDDGSDVFRDFGTQFNAFINAPSRQLLRDRNATQATVMCRLRLGDVGSDASHERVLRLPVNFVW